jgi:hypothetical protein
LFTIASTGSSHCEAFFLKTPHRMLAFVTDYVTKCCICEGGLGVCFFRARHVVRSYNYLVSSAGAVEGHYVELLESRLLELLYALLTGVSVDETWYLGTYPDVADAVKAGKMKSAREHYIRAGYFENRLPGPIRVDERWYTNEYPDVSAAIKSGAFMSGQQHFERSGFKEGRLPAAGWSLLG